jgi:hypothetical protein
MQLLFAEKHTLFLQFIELLFGRLRILPGCSILPVTVNAPANYVYNALPAWTHACIVDVNNGGTTSGLTTERAFSPTSHKNKPVTKVRVQPPTFDEQDRAPDAAQVAPDAAFDEAMAQVSRGYLATTQLAKTNAYFMMRAALVTIASVRRKNGLDVVVVPCLGPVTPETALAMYLATREFFKLQ